MMDRTKEWLIRINVMLVMVIGFIAQWHTRVNHHDIIQLKYHLAEIDQRISNLNELELAAKLGENIATGHYIINTENGTGVLVNLDEITMQEY